MKIIYLSKGLSTCVDDEDYAYLSQFSWYTHRSKSGWYARRTVQKDGRKIGIRMHRKIMGITDPKIQVDHADGNGLNNVRGNLRVCTNTNNAWNRKTNSANQHGYKGVKRITTKSGAERWVARITYGGTRQHIGTYGSPQEAHEAYCQRAAELFGEFFNAG